MDRCQALDALTLDSVAKFYCGTMEYLIVAIDHALQLARRPEDPQNLRLQKDQLERLLRAEIAARNVGFIAEECKEGETTVALGLALRNNPPIPWKNITMTDTQRTEAGIAHALKKRPGQPDNETMQTWIEMRIPEDDVRENFFVKETIRCAQDAKSILMLLGDMHVDAVAAKLEKLGYRVCANHDLIPIRRWETRDD